MQVIGCGKCEVERRSGSENRRSGWSGGHKDGRFLAEGMKVGVSIAGKKPAGNIGLKQITIMGSSQGGQNGVNGWLRAQWRKRGSGCRTRRVIERFWMGRLRRRMNVMMMVVVVVVVRM